MEMARKKPQKPTQEKQDDRWNNITAPVYFRAGNTPVCISALKHKLNSAVFAVQCTDDSWDLYL